MRIKRQNKKMAEGDMTPMIDMVFQLIAFFMVLINFSEMEQDQRVNLPLSELAQPPEVPYEEPLTLQMTGEEGIILNAGSPDLLTIDQLRIALKREAQIIRAAGDDVRLSDVTVIIRADREARTGMVQEMIEAAQEAEFETFALRSRQTEVEIQGTP